jgi:hypothetical protein
MSKDGHASWTKVPVITYKTKREYDSWVRCFREYKAAHPDWCEPSLSPDPKRCTWRPGT